LADAFTKQVIENGPRNYRALYTLLSDGSGVTGYVAADPTATGDMGVNIAGNILYPGVNLKIWDMRYSLEDTQLQMVWDATTPQNAFLLTGEGGTKQNFKERGGIPVPRIAGIPITGATGKIIFNLLNPTVGAILTLDLWLKKDVAQ